MGLLSSEFQYGEFSENVRGLFGTTGDNCHGKNEYFISLDQLAENLTGTLNEAPDLHFELLDEWYECLKVAEGGPI